jgi:beta-lactamase regulating signal transducer with metallopeptidase domain
MLTMISTTNNLAERWLAVVLAVAWQFALLVVAATLVAWLLRRASPVVRYWLWQIVAIKLLLMPFWTWAIPLPIWAESRAIDLVARDRPAVNPIENLPRPAVRHDAPASDVSDANAAPAASPFSEALAEIGWQAWLLAAWGIAVLGLLLRLVQQRLRLARLLGRAVPADGELTQLVAELAGQIGLRRPPEALSIGGDCPLFVCGLWRQRLILPESLMAVLGYAERRQVILHELAHVKRHDLLWGWSIEIARIVYFFHPLVYWVAYQLRFERELACDQLAMARSGHSPADYAQTLVQVVGHASEPASLQVAAISAGLAGNEPAERPSQSNDL